MSVLENPFFIREARAYSRRAWSPLCWFVLAAALLPLFPLWLEHHYGANNDGPGVIAFRGLLLFTVAAGHALLCAFAGWQLGTRVFGSEHRQNTLEGLRLVSSSPWFWVLQKLVFPLYGLLLVWLAAAPGCFGLVLRGVFLPQSVLPGLNLAGCAGILAFASALTIAPERIGLPKSSERALPLAERIEIASLRLVPSWLSWQLLQIGYRWISRGAQNQALWLPPRSLFGVAWVREDQAFAVMLVVFVACALASAWAWANPSSPAAVRLRSALQFLTIAAAYLMLVGFTWAGSFWMWKAILVVVPLVQGVRLLQDRRRVYKAAHRKIVREDQRAHREIGAIQRWRDNPVLVRDLRVALRGHALLWLLVRQCLAITAIAVVIAATIYGNPWGPPPSNYAFQAFSATMASLLAWVAFVTVLRLGSRASLQWNGERRMKTLSQLFLSPISSLDIVHGRWIATLIEGVTVALPWVLGFFFFLLIGEEMPNLGTIFSIAIWILSLAVVLSVGLAGAFRTLRRWRDFFSAHGLAVLLTVGEPMLLIWGLSQADGGGSEAITAGTLCLALVNAVALPMLLWGAARGIQAYRNESLE